MAGNPMQHEKLCTDRFPGLSTGSSISIASTFSYIAKGNDGFWRTILFRRFTTAGSIVFRTGVGTLTHFVALPLHQRRYYQARERGKTHVFNVRAESFVRGSARLGSGGCSVIHCMPGSG